MKKAVIIACMLLQATGPAPARAEQESTTLGEAALRALRAHCAHDESFAPCALQELAQAAHGGDTEARRRLEEDCATDTPLACELADTAPIEATPAVAGDPELSSFIPILHRPDRTELRYPPEARRRGTEGDVLVELLIGLDGSVLEMEAIEGPDVFTEAALEHAAKYRFGPYESSTGAPALARFELRTRFRLRGDGAPAQPGFPPAPEREGPGPYAEAPGGRLLATLQLQCALQPDHPSCEVASLVPALEAGENDAVLALEAACRRRIVPACALHLNTAPAGPLYAPGERGDGLNRLTVRRAPDPEQLVHPTRAEVRQYGDALREPVVVEVVVGTDGAPLAGTVVSGHPLLHDRALAHVRRYRFDAPTHEDGSPALGRTQVTLSFVHPRDRGRRRR